MESPPSTFQTIAAGKCPRCRRGNLFVNRMFHPRFLQMYEHCPHCGLRFEVEPGFFWGAMYIAYAIISALFIAALFVYGFFIDQDASLLLIVIPVYVLMVILLIPFTVRTSRILMLHIFGGVRFQQEYFEQPPQKPQS